MNYVSVNSLKYSLIVGINYDLARFILSHLEEASLIRDTTKSPTMARKESSRWFVERDLTRGDPQIGFQRWYALKTVQNDLASSAVRPFFFVGVFWKSALFEYFEIPPSPFLYWRISLQILIEFILPFILSIFHANPKNISLDVATRKKRICS